MPCGGGGGGGEGGGVWTVKLQHASHTRPIMRIGKGAIDLVDVTAIYFGGLAPVRIK